MSVFNDVSKPIETGEVDYVRLVHCPDNFAYDNGSNTCLQLVTLPTSWSSAAAECHRLNERAHLVLIESDTKQTAVEEFMENGELIQPATSPFRILVMTQWVNVKTL